MADFDALLSAAESSLFGFYGEAVLYTTAAGVSFSVKAVFDPSVELIDSQYGQVVERVTAFILPRSEIDNPGQGDRIVLGGAAYIVEGEMGRDKTTVTVRVKHDA